MRRALLLVGLVFGLAAVPSAAQARCGLGCLANRISSLKHQVNTLQGEVSRDSNQLSALNSCLFEVPVTQYGDPSGSYGYVFDNNNGLGPFDTTALDGTASGDPVSAWFFIDHCNTQPVAGTFRPNMRGHGAVAPQAALPSVPRKH